MCLTITLRAGGRRGCLVADSRRHDRQEPGVLPAAIPRRRAGDRCGPQHQRRFHRVRYAALLCQLAAWQVTLELRQGA